MEEEPQRSEAEKLAEMCQLYEDLSEIPTVMRARVVSGHDYVPFEIHTILGKTDERGKTVANQIRIDFKSKNRSIIHHRTVIPQSERYNLFAYSKDSKYMASVIKYEEEVVLHVASTQFDDTVAEVSLSQSKEYGDVIMNGERAVLKFSHDAKRIVLMAHSNRGKTRPPVLVVASVTEETTTCYEMPPLQNMDIYSVTWTPDDEGVVFVNRRGLHQKDDIVYFSFRDLKTKTTLDFRKTKHLEFAPSGNQLVVFGAPNPDTGVDLPIIVIDWPFSNRQRNVIGPSGFEFINCPDRCWARNRYLLFNACYLSGPAIMYLDTSIDVAFRFSVCPELLGELHDFQDDEMLVTHSLIASMPRLRMLPFKPELKGKTLSVEALKTVADFYTVPTVPVPEQVCDLLVYPEHPAHKSAGFLLLPGRFEEGKPDKPIDGRSIPLVVIPNPGTTMHCYTVYPSPAVHVLVAAGFAVLVANYRYPVDPGYSTCRAMPKERKAADSEDTHLIVTDTLQKYRCLDSERIYLMGERYGSFVAARMLTMYRTYRAAALVSPILHFVCHCRHHTKDVQKAKALEPLSKAALIKTPLLLLQDSAEPDAKDYTRFCDKLTEHNVPNVSKKIDFETQKYVIECVHWFEKHK